MKLTTSLNKELIAQVARTFFYSYAMPIISNIGMYIDERSVKK